MQKRPPVVCREPLRWVDDERSYLLLTVRGNRLPPLLWGVIDLASVTYGERVFDQALLGRGVIDHVLLWWVVID